MGDAVEARAPLVVGLHRPPGRLLDVRMAEHLVLGLRVLDPLGHGLQVHRAQLPPPCGVPRPLLEAALLFLVADREPVLDQDDAVLHEQPLEDRRLPQEAVVLGLRAEPEHALDAEYARQRQQFGQPIAGFQGVQFLLADMAKEVEAARLLTWQAAWLVDRGTPGARESAIAKLVAADTAMRVTTDAVQV